MSDNQVTSKELAEFLKPLMERFPLDGFLLIRFREIRNHEDGTSDVSMSMSLRGPDLDSGVVLGVLQSAADRMSQRRISSAYQVGRTPRGWDG